MDFNTPTPIADDVQAKLPRGMFRAGAKGEVILDAMSGRASLFGFGFEPIQTAIEAAAANYLGDHAGGEPTTVERAAWQTPGAHPSENELARIRQTIGELLGEDSGLQLASLRLVPAVDLAVEDAILRARHQAADTRFATVALVGSMHGRTGLCRSAGGDPDLQANLGPLMAGFQHVRVGDVAALEAAVTEQTACVLLSPVDLSDGARPLSRDFLVAAAERCAATGALLIIDETRICFAASGMPFSFRAIADVQADAVLLSAGLFAGVSAAVVLASNKLAEDATIATATLPLQQAILGATVDQLTSQGLLTNLVESTATLINELADVVGRFEFVRDVRALGRTIGIESDVASRELIAEAAHRGLRLDAAGEFAVWMQPPVVLDEQDRNELVQRLGQVFESVEQETSIAS